ncbi:MAG: GFA family protein [Myxococcota bacterium]
MSPLQALHRRQRSATCRPSRRAPASSAPGPARHDVRAGGREQAQAARREGSGGCDTVDCLARSGTRRVRDEAKLEGGCYCRNVRYESTGDVGLRGQCFCRECQYISGGDSVLIVGVPEDGFRLTKGQTKAFRRSDLEHPVTREFCPDCGTHVTTRAMPGMVMIKVGTWTIPRSSARPDGDLHLRQAALPSPRRGRTELRASAGLTASAAPGPLAGVPGALVHGAASADGTRTSPGAPVAKPIPPSRIASPAVLKSSNLELVIRRAGSRSPRRLRPTITVRDHRRTASSHRPSRGSPHDPTEPGGSRRPARRARRGILEEDDPASTSRTEADRDLVTPVSVPVAERREGASAARIDLTAARPAQRRPRS